MLPRQNRLKRRQDFEQVHTKGKRYNGRFIRLRVFRTADAQAPTLIGISISKKVAKRAVTRNSIKRQLRAIFRQLLSQLKQEGLQIVASVSALPDDLAYEQLLHDLTKLLSEAGILHGS